MKRTHQKVHCFTWLLLLPLLVLVIVHAQPGRVAVKEQYEETRIPPNGRNLP